MNDLNKIINTPLFQIRNIFDLNWKKIQNSNAVGNFLMISNLTVDSTCTLKFKFRSHDKNCNMNLTESSMKSYYIFQNFESEFETVLLTETVRWTGNFR